LDATSAVASDPNPIPQPHVADKPGRRAAITRLSDDVTRFDPGVIHRGVIRANDETVVSDLKTGNAAKAVETPPQQPGTSLCHYPAMICPMQMICATGVALSTPGHLRRDRPGTLAQAFDKMP
jgi:hypothetical protein